MTWILVSKVRPGPLYVRGLYVARGRTSVDWTDDSDRAARFARREDAEGIAGGVAGERLEAVEPVVGDAAPGWRNVAMATGASEAEIRFALEQLRQGLMRPLILDSAGAGSTAELAAELAAECGIAAMREVIDVLEEACFDEGRSRSAAATESARKARGAVDAKVEEWARSIAQIEAWRQELSATLEAVTAHAARCPVGYRVGEAGELLLWIPDDRPQRGLQLWLRELDELLGRSAPCDGDHAAPACADPQCWRRDPIG